MEQAVSEQSALDFLNAVRAQPPSERQRWSTLEACVQAASAQGFSFDVGQLRRAWTLDWQLRARYLVQSMPPESKSSQ